MPNAITLTSEYCPARRRSLLVTTMFCGFTIGSALGGAAASLIEHHGWRSVLVVGGAAPLLLLPVLTWRLPESVRYLVNAGAARERIAAMLARIAPDPRLANASFIAPAGKPAGSPLGRLFGADLLRGTLLLWLTFFMSLLVIYLLSSWLPTLLRTTGATLQTAARVTAMFQIGGTLGAIVLGGLMDRFDPHRVLACSYAAAGVFVAAIGVFAASPWGAALAVFAAGFCVSGSQVGANALSAAFYPTECRTTGVSWANGSAVAARSSDRWRRRDARNGRAVVDCVCRRRGAVRDRGDGGAGARCGACRCGAHAGREGDCGRADHLSEGGGARPPAGNQRGAILYKLI